MESLCKAFDENNKHNNNNNNSQIHQTPNFGSMVQQLGSQMIKSQIANHPHYPNLVSALIDCKKVGASEKMVRILEGIHRETIYSSSSSNYQIGVDPELDQFMEEYCEMLHRCKEDLTRSYDEARDFLNNIKSQLSDLCVETSFDYPSDEEVGNSEEEMSNGGEMDFHEILSSNQIKEILMKKYSGHLSKLRKEFMKKRKKGKLPKDARLSLFNWWNSHYKWPYPTEDEKAKLSEETGLEQKQINNWFINQRKRHWKPHEDITFALFNPNHIQQQQQPIYLNNTTTTTPSTDHHHYCNN